MMNAEAAILEAQPWSLRRWFWGIVLILAVHVGLILFLGEKQDQAPRPKTVITRVRVVPEDRIDPLLSEVMALKDPTLFALPNARGFSGSAWLNRPPFPYQITNGTAPPQWLTPNMALLGDEFGEFVRRSFTPGSLTADKELPSVPRLQTGRSPAVIQTLLRIEGDLAERRLISTNSLPALEPDKVLSHSGANPVADRCVIRVLVNAAGETISAATVVRSASDQADRNAENFAKSARFTPLEPDPSAAEGGDLTLGYFVFRWVMVDAMEPAERAQNLSQP